MATRRGFLKSTLNACWTGAALMEQSVFRATQARAQARPGMRSLFDIQKVADGVYAAIAKPTAVLNCNAAIFENANDLLVVDTHSKPSAVVALVSQLRAEVTKKPVRYIVNSHFHWDHSQGTSAYRKMNPHAQVVSSEATRRLLSENGASRLKQSLDQMRATLEQVEQQRGKTKDAAQVGRLKEQSDGIKAYIAEMQNYTPELPDLTFDRDLILHDKAHDLHLAFRGRAHTMGDVVVFCPQKKVVATGDMIHSMLPFIGDGFPRDWPKTIKSIAELPFDVVAGGHGPVQQGKARLLEMASYIEEITSRVEREKTQPLEQLQRSIVPSKLKSLSGEYGKFLLQNFSAAGSAGDPAAALALSVQNNVAQVLDRLNAG
jgi:cyclase